MPMLYTGKKRGFVEHDKVYELDFGDQGVTKIGIIYPKVPNAEAGLRNRERLLSIARQVALEVALKDAAEAEEREAAQGVKAKVGT